jgi:hypothetical protein
MKGKIFQNDCEMGIFMESAAGFLFLTKSWIEARRGLNWNLTL